MSTLLPRWTEKLAGRFEEVIFVCFELDKVATSEAGNISSDLLTRGGGARSILLLPLVARCLETIYVRLRAGSQVFALLMVFRCVILHTMSSGKSLQLLCIFPFGMLCLSVISMIFVKIMLAVCILLGMVV